MVSIGYQGRFKFITSLIGKKNQIGAKYGIKQPI